MKFRKIISTVSAISLAATNLALSQSYVFAETTFSSPSDFITDVVNVSLVDIESTTKSTAISNMKSNITISGDEVFYDGTSIGYWYSDDSSTLYANSSKTDILIEASGSGYNVDPTLLGTILTDVNADLIENYTPTTGDWSKIIGKYDVTLGSITIPADQWISIPPATIPTTSNLSNAIDISQLSGIDGTTVTNAFTDNNLYIMSWLIDTNGDLYLQAGLVCIASTQNASGEAWYYCTDILSSTVGSWNTSTQLRSATKYIKAAPYAYKNSSGNYANLMCAVAATDIANSKSANMTGNTSTISVMHKVDNASIKNTTTKIENAKACGIVYMTGSQFEVASLNEMHTKHEEMFTSNSCSKEVIGNKTLTKRILKLGALAADDILNVSAAGWIINGTTNIDKYLASQYIVAAGDTASIDVTAEIEPLSFKVVVPTTLPIYVSTDGTVTTATNATVENQSNAAVKITDLEIIADAESGWTLVDSAPSSMRDANEFTFTTSLTVDTELSVDEVLPFTYNAELSPITAGTESFNLATVLLTVDWADI